MKRKTPISKQEENDAVSYALALQREFHLPQPIRFVGDIEAGHVQMLSQSAVAWYEPETDAIYVNIQKLKAVCETSDEHTMQDIMGETLFHEAVGHYGLRLLLGNRFEDTMRHIYDHADESLGKRLWEKRSQLEGMRDAQGRYLHRRAPEPQMRVLAVEELMSDMAQHLHSNRPRHRSLLSRFARRLGEALEAMCFPYSRVTERDLVRMLERSYQKVEGRSLPGKAVDWVVRKQPRLAFLESFVAKHTQQSRDILHGNPPDRSESSALWVNALKLLGFILIPYIMAPAYAIHKIRNMSPTRIRSGQTPSRMPIARELLNRYPPVLEGGGGASTGGKAMHPQCQRAQKKEDSAEKAM